jgi:hypothetical protein
MRQCCAVKNQHENNKISGAEMRMLYWMCGKTRQDMIINDIREREKVGVAPIVENLGDTKAPLKLKGRLYRTTVTRRCCMRQCCAVKNQHENNKISGAEMRMLHWMCGKSRQDRIINDIRERELG